MAQIRRLGPSVGGWPSGAVLHSSHEPGVWCLCSEFMDMLWHFINFGYYYIYALSSKSSRGLKTKLKKKLKTTGMTRGPMRRFQGSCREATQR